MSENPHEPPNGPRDEQLEAVVVAEFASPPGPGVLAALGWLLAMFGVQLMVGIVAAAFALAVGTKPTDGRGTAILLSIGTAGNMLFAALVVTVLYRRQVSRVLALRNINLLHVVLVILIVPPMSLVASEVNNCVAELTSGLSLMMEMFSEFSKQSFWLVLIVGCLFPAVGEEVYFRGFLGRGLVARHGVVIGTLLAALLFAVIHVDPVQASGALVLGIGLQLIYLATKTLLAPVLVHLLNNALAFISPRLPPCLQVEGFTAAAEDGVAHTPVLLVIASLGALITLGLLFYSVRIRWILPDGGIWSPGYRTAEQPPEAVEAQARCENPALSRVLVAVVGYSAFVAAFVWAVQR